jgi:hypothetical protein
VLGEPYGVEKTGTAERWRYYIALRETACGVLCAIVIGSVAPPSPASAGSQAPRPSTEWSALLEAFTRHDERGKAVVQNAAGHVRESPERGLARMLLAEWGPPVRPERLQRPEIVLLPRVVPSTRTVTMEIFDLNVRVGPDGRVVAAAFLKPPQQPRLSREVLAKVRAALFRPAFRDGRFVESEAAMEYTVHVK